MQERLHGPWSLRKVRQAGDSVTQKQHPPRSTKNQPAFPGTVRPRKCCYKPSQQNGCCVRCRLDGKTLTSGRCFEVLTWSWKEGAR